MTDAVQEIEVGGKRYAVTTDRHIVRSLREVTLTAHNERGEPVMRYSMNTAAARGYLNRDAESSPPTWEELEDIALSMMKIELEE